MAGIGGIGDGTQNGFSSGAGYACGGLGTTGLRGGATAVCGKLAAPLQGSMEVSVGAVTGADGIQPLDSESGGEKTLVGACSASLAALAAFLAALARSLSDADAS